MVTVDLKQPDESLMKLLKARCLRFGSVVSIKLRRDQTPLAMIEMASRAEALELAVQEGAALVGAIVMIHLVSGLAGH